MDTTPGVCYCKHQMSDFMDKTLTFHGKHLEMSKKMERKDAITYCGKESHFFAYFSLMSCFVELLKSLALCWGVNPYISYMQKSR